MMQELRLVLIVLGALAIAALLLHGLWTNKKEKTTKFGEKPLGKLEDDNDAQKFDQDGIGAVRVVSNTKHGNEKPARQEPAVSFGDKPDVDPLFAGDTQVASDSEQTLYPSMSATDDDPSFASASVASNDGDETGETEAANIASAQPEAETMHTDGATQAEVDEHESHERASEKTATQADEPDDTEVLVLHVHANNNAVFSGLDLIPTLEQYGLRFGDMGIYHRHSDLSGSGKVLFSVANMVKPGTFDVSHSESFETPGISFFMTLPCYGEPEQNFKLMLQTAQQIADELGGLVLDDARSMMTPSRLDEYRERVKAFNAS
ncbi:cell division protein ZipA [Salinivibrio sp. MA351]|uniref:cell division protein ZipA n=1 Tax=unclassified Salinivibrio TaxID=2636825 RepID=UPI0009889BF6|nr:MULTISPECIES: cell division protein ZipA [unclassified Salinivibrio]OOE99517.1 cell division protein ZipA [Salinivibrio sp. MA351]OOF03406.1 cell division protein ZipA [Salinivibrio sp. MA607]